MKNKMCGVIEGYYGNELGHEERLELISFISKIGLNTYMYAPKNNIKHRDKWGVEYNSIEIDSFKDIVNRCKREKVKFFYTISPGIDISYSDENDFEILVDKLRMMFELGVKDFGLFLDDIKSDFINSKDKKRFENFAEAHAYLCNRVYAQISKWDNEISMVMCPTDYHTSRFSEYITVLSEKLDDNIEMFWTGYEVCSSEITIEETKEVADKFKRNPLIWDNYPVNDGGMKKQLHIGPYMGRDKELIKHTSGIILNIMEKAESSKISLMTFADYLFNERYNPFSSWEKALNKIEGKFSKELEIFAENSLKSCLTKRGTRKLNILVDQYLENKEKNKSELYEYLYRCNEAAKILIGKMENKKLLSEILDWLIKFSIQSEYLVKFLEGDSSLNDKLISINKSKDYVVMDNEPIRIIKGEM